MLLPIVLLLASAGSIQPTESIATRNPQQSASSERPRTLLTDPGANRFVIGPRRNRQSPDEGIIIPASPRRNTGCLSITAYVFSDGESPELQYVTHCPNLDVPYQTQRARHNLPNNEQQPDLKRTKK
jgi:hypothetical protein